MCVDDDGGLVIAPPPDDDAGVSMEPMAGSGGRAGSAASASGGSGGRGVMDAGTRPGGPADSCSCTANDDDPKHGRVHVCTEGQTRAACDDFSCTLGRVDPDHACSRSGVRLCCVMKSRGLVSVLYDDCTQANCSAGFTQQCADFDGTLHDADCESFMRGQSGHDQSGDGCAVASTSASSDLSGIALGVLGLIVARRRRFRGSRYLAV